ncbi:MAG: AmmeMemoRadiSam system protein B [Candidatus Saccharicenans sp.]|nr:MAG: AmmeMemoRadiSam system protein B [Candidatus Aminicenantes bacterium]HEK85008.1 AmmeMemoRadiSam system protein B [Candidatus Aminicenantes bacterium]
MIIGRPRKINSSIRRSIMGLLLFIFLIAASGLLLAMAARTPVDKQKIRPIRDDVGFCWKADSMKILVDYLASEEKEKFSPTGLVAAISPHDDYLYAGRLYYPLFSTIKTKEAVIFGVTHGTVRSEIKGLDSILILDDFELWPGVLKPIAASTLREYIKSHLNSNYYIVNDRAQEIEHSIEALLPFLQYFNPEVKITPIMVTPMPLDKMEEISERLAEVISTYMKEHNLTAGKDIFFLISADGNHYGKDFNNLAFGEGQEAWEKARAFDRQLIANYMTGIIDDKKIAGLTTEFWGKTYLDYKNSYWCGKYSIPFGLLTIEKVIKKNLNKEIKGQLFGYSDSYSEGVLPLRKIGLGTTAPFSLRHWVSYAAIGYYLH